MPELPPGTPEQYAPRGGRAFLDRALAELADGPLASVDQHSRLPADIVEVAATFNAEQAAHDERARIGTVSEQLARIEAACAALAQAFDGASHAALNALHGHGVGAAPMGGLFLIPEGPQIAALLTLAGRYFVPLGPSASAEALAELLERPRGHDFAGEARLLDWPTAAAALGAAVRLRREAFEAGFRADVARAAAVLDHGPAGALAPAVGRRPRGRAGSRRNELCDRGGQENVSDLMRGPPKWILARDCCSLMGLHWPDEDIRGTRGGRLYRFTLAVYGLATGEAVEERQGVGGAYDAGLARHVQAAARICAALGAINRPTGGFEPLSADARRRKASLERAWDAGRVPRWLP